MRLFPALFAAALWAAAASLLAVACGTADIPVLASAGLGDGGAPSTLPEGGGTHADFCAGSGPPAFADGSGGVACAGSLVTNAFRFALCTCEGIVSDHAITTDAFDGDQGPYDAARAKIGGSVGSNGNVNASAPLDIGGSLWASDPTGLTTNASLIARGELHAAGKVNAGPSLTVDTDAFLAGGLQTTGDVLIAGTLFTPSSAAIGIGGKQTIGATVVAPVQVDAPCDCSPAHRVDVHGIVESYRAANDDAASGIDPSLLENVSTPLSKTLGCGRYFFSRVGAHATVDLTANGRVAIFVGGDFSADQDFIVHVPPGSEVDFFIEGNLVAAGRLLLGDPQFPARSRAYVGGTGTVNLQNANQLVGNLYAPDAQLVLGGKAAATVFGSIFTKRLSSGADLTIHFDESVARKAASCPLPTQCTTCHDCGNQACRAGSCGACADSSECCAPYVCRSGTCVLDIR